MQIILRQKPQQPIIVQGLPGIGMVGAIAAEFLLQHLETKLIGKIVLDNSPPLVAVHEGRLIEPYSIYYNKKYNLLIIHSIISTPGAEWQLADAIMEIGKQLKAKEIISLEGIGSSTELNTSKTFYYTTLDAREKSLEKGSVEKLKEGIIMGATSALLSKSEGIPISCIFAETHTNLPDSKAAAELIKALDVVLDLKVDYKPLLTLAAKFEEKLKGIMVQSVNAKELADKKQLSYVG